MFSFSQHHFLFSSDQSSLVVQSGFFSAGLTQVTEFFLGQPFPNLLPGAQFGPNLQKKLSVSEFCGYLSHPQSGN